MNIYFVLLLSILAFILVTALVTIAYERPTLGSPKVPIENKKRIKKLIRWLGCKCGIVTWYHVSFIYKTTKGEATHSLVCEIRPWLHEDCYQELTDFTYKKAVDNITTPTIMSITKLGI